MLFSSIEFAFFFLPVVFGLYHLLRHFHLAYLCPWLLLLASVFFYGWWNLNYLLLLAISILINYCFALFIQSRKHRQLAQMFCVVGVLFNLMLLAYYKYAVFIVDSWHFWSGTINTNFSVLLPLAISFFTFQQIAFLVDCYHKKFDVHTVSIPQYSLFVLFFPQLIAGPIVHHRDLIPQLKEAFLGRISAQYLLMGFAIFFIGLFKKVMIADFYGDIEGPIFSRYSAGYPIDVLVAWQGVLAYTLRIYFDFSAYSDMAIGLALLFGFLLPVNFYSPYKSQDLREFWRRWNMTLGRFFHEYVYIPLGGRSGGIPVKVYCMFLVMLLSGFWHGAGWNFVIWGVMHGVGVVVVIVWQNFFRDPLLSSVIHSAWYKVGGIVVTFLFFALSMVAFRITEIDKVLSYYQLLFSIDSGSFEQYKDAVNFWQVRDMSINVVYGSIVAGFLISFLFKNTMQLVGYIPDDQRALNKAKPATSLLVFAGILGGLALIQLLSKTSNEFIYFAF